MEIKDDFFEEESDLYEHHRFVADKKQGHIRLDMYVMTRIENASRNKVQNAIKAGNVLVNNEPAKSNYKVKPSDVITVVMTHPPRETEIIAENIPLNILYEDEDIIVINKEAGMVVHPAYANFQGTLVNGLKYYFENVSKSGEDSIPALVHRIDKDTSGILIIAKNEVVQTKLAKQFYDHTIKRTYVALVWGDFNEEEGKIEGNIGRNPKNRLIMTVFPDGEHGKHAITHYKLLRRFGYVSLLECRLETGRTHQIRTHLSYIGHPLFNDEKYGGNAILKGTTFTKYKQFVQNCFKIIPRQALHAKSLGFIHPSSGEEMYFESELPMDMKEVIEKWEKYSTFHETFEE